MVQQLNCLLSVTQLATDEREEVNVISQNRMTVKNCLATRVPAEAYCSSIM